MGIFARRATIDLSVGVGLNGPDIAGFINTYLNPANAGSVQKNYLPELLVYMDNLEGSTLIPTEALTDFERLSAAKQLPFIAGVYFDEIKAGGESYAATKVGYNRSYKAIETLFPGSSLSAGVPTNAYNGTLSLYHDARIRTEQGGDVNAGKGKQTSVVTRSPNTLYNLYADMTEIPATPQTGAGIATLVGVTGVPPGNVDLFAPNGIIDAGEAGIRVSGNLTVAALEILHVQNIQVQGHAVGLPTIVGPNVAAAIAASNTTGATNSAAEEAVKQQTSASEQEVVPSLITVEVLGYGGGE